ncbi:MAG TPA: YHS domain-containing (seleno)protein [Xanthobacteraceae bacterium]|nr:YHS domain-containing (seleno)protein [Xanthobacteraceae bacterium]
MDRARVWPGVAVLCAAWAGGMVLAATTERVVTNPRTGLAIDGFDPVAYFIDGAATPGRLDFEFRYHDVIWRFCNPGNRAAFAGNPGDYEPRFGGYDPIAVGRGAPTPGNPEIWLIWEQKLYLFFDTRTRDEFAADPRRMVMQAETRWPDILRHVLSQ